jgi:hypothetical protein
MGEIKMIKRTQLLAWALLAAAAPIGAQAQSLGSERGPRLVQPTQAEEAHASADVFQLDHLRRIGRLSGKLFATAGGDPAINGIYTYLAFYHSPAEGFRIFPIGDFEEYRLVSQQPGRVIITVRQTSHTGGSNPFKTSARRLTITWPLRGETIPDTITVTDAR